jgi:hypothetical protein
MATSQLPDRVSMLKPQDVGSLYAEASYFDGAHFAHIAAWQENQRMRRIARLIDRDHRFPIIARQLRARMEA